MPPRKRGTPADSAPERRVAGRRGAAPATLAASTTGSSLASNVNSKYWAQLAEQLNTITGHCDLQGIRTAAAVGITGTSESGTQAPFSADDAIKALTSKKSYKCAASIFIMDMLRPVSDIPIAERSIAMLQNWHFAAPAPCEIEVCMLESEVPNIATLAGTLVRTSSDEQLMAFFRACAADIAADRNVAEWKTAMLTCSCTMHAVPDAAKMWALASQARDNATELRDAIGMTGFQRIHDLMSLYKKRGSKLTPEKLAEEYNKSIMVSSSSETVNKTFCDMALTIWNRALSLPEVNAVIVAMEEYRHASIFGQVSKMQAIIDKCGKSPQLVKWVFCGLADQFVAKKLTADATTVRALLGKTAGSHGKGTVDLMIMRMHIRDYIINILIPSLGISQGVAMKLKDISDSHAAYRQNAGFEHLQDLPDQSWRGGWSEAECAVLQLLEDVVFNVTYDDVIKTGVKASKCAEDIMGTLTLASAVSNIKALAETEAQQRDGEVVVTALGTSVSADDEAHTLPDDTLTSLTPAMARVVADIRTISGRELTTEELTTIQTFGMKSKRALWGAVKLMVFNMSEARMTEALLETTVAQRRGEPGKAYTGILLDVKHLGTSVTAPHLRIPTLNQNVVKSMLRSFIRTRDINALHPGDIFFVLDGATHSYRQKLLHVFIDETGSSIQKCEKLVYLLFDEESMRRRKGCIRGMNALQQVEYLSIISHGSLDELPFREHKHFTGSNQGNKLGDLKLPHMDTIWKLAPAERKQLFADPGNTWWVEVGGPTPNPDGTAGPGRGSKKLPVQNEPVFWHPSDPHYFEELAHSFCLRDVYDLTAADGTAALTFARLKVPYVGLCLTQRHKDALSEWLEYKHFSASFATEPALAAMFPQVTSDSNAAPKTMLSAKTKPQASSPSSSAAVACAGSSQGSSQGTTTAKDLMQRFHEKLQNMTRKSEAAPENPDSDE